MKKMYDDQAKSKWKDSLTLENIWMEFKLWGSKEKSYNSSNW